MLTSPLAFVPAIPWFVATRRNVVRLGGVPRLPGRYNSPFVSEVDSAIVKWRSQYEIGSVQHYTTSGFPTFHGGDSCWLVVVAGTRCAIPWRPWERRRLLSHR